jgi:predicted permease
VVLPIIAGLLVNASGLAVPSLIDELLVQLGQAVIPLCLILIGVSLNQYGFVFTGRGMAALVAIKLLVLPAVVLVVGHWVFGLEALPLTVAVMAAALPAGSNPLLFAQRYRVLEAETTSAITVSTLAFVLTAPLWLAVVAWVVGS